MTHRKLLKVFLDSMPAPTQTQHQTVEGTPYPFDRWILDRIACAIGQMEDAEQPEQCWRPIVDLGPGARYWVECYLNYWLINGSQSAVSPEYFSRRWEELIRYFVESPLWQPGHHICSRDGQSAALGFGFMRENVKDERFAEAFRRLEPILNRWAELWLVDGDMIARFAQLLAMPSFRFLVLSGLRQIAAKLSECGPDRWQDDDQRGANEIVKLLLVAWTNHRAQLGHDANLQQAFNAILNAMVSRSVPGALQLHDLVTLQS